MAFNMGCDEPKYIATSLTDYEIWVGMGARTWKCCCGFSANSHGGVDGHAPHCRHCNSMYYLREKVAREDVRRRG